MRDRHATDPLRVRLEAIGPDGLDVDEPVTVAWLAASLGEDGPFSAKEAGRLRAHLHRIDDVVHVRGQLSVRLRADCSRCLEEVPLALDTRIEVAMFPVDGEPPAGPDGELRAEDMGVATYDDDEIDLGQILHDEVFLELPMSPICSESCAGLCPSCGINLNAQSCDCEQPIDDRWSALRQIKLN